VQGTALASRLLRQKRHPNCEIRPSQGPRAAFCRRFRRYRRSRVLPALFVTLIFHWQVGPKRLL
jgi:hypothetical protein